MSSDEPMDVPAWLRNQPIGTVFAHASPGHMPDSWVKEERGYRRTYDWVRFKAEDFKWHHVEPTAPIEGSITEEEADGLGERARLLSPHLAALLLDPELASGGSTTIVRSRKPPNDGATLGQGGQGAVDD
ncbi:hypothetical protein [Leifsonia sp. NPDC058248]|uniref:hypothetical protein n=1 Tax=Leifsonia sp. NPDC058248 TaxID=3346402 RepID=UPI0036DA4AB2